MKDLKLRRGIRRSTSSKSVPSSAIGHEAHEHFVRRRDDIGTVRSRTRMSQRAPISRDGRAVVNFDIIEWTLHVKVGECKSNISH